MKLIKGSNNKDTKEINFVYKERKEREEKPKVLLPDEFYTSKRKGYFWCEDCKGNSINVLNGDILTCFLGHKKKLIRGNGQISKPRAVLYSEILQINKEVREAPALFLT
jgi:hypothetical protein